MFFGILYVFKEVNIKGEKRKAFLKGLSLDSGEGGRILFHTDTTLDRFEFFVTYSFDLFNIFNGLKTAILLPIFNDRLGSFFSDALYARKLSCRSRIDIY